MRRQRADVAPDFGALGAPAVRCSLDGLVVVGRRRPLGAVAAQIERQLLGANNRRALRAGAEDQPLQRRDLRPKPVVLAVESEDDFDERGRIGREIFGANRHMAKLHATTLSRQQNEAIQPTFVGRFVGLTAACIHSPNPSRSIVNCVVVSRITPP